jgi:PPOX class probable F420-dependent enzyme
MTEPIAERPAFVDDYAVPEGAPFHPVAWSVVRAKLVASKNYWVVTTRADGSAHAAPVWGLWREESLVFGTAPESVKGKNLRRDPRVAVHLESGDDVVMIRGTVTTVRDSGMSTDGLLDDYEAKYAVRPPGDPADYFRVMPQSVLHWLEAEYPESQVRFRFP